MTQEFHRTMAEATRLTRNGDVVAATVLIQQALKDRRFAAPFDAPFASAPAGDVIDVEAREVFDATARLLPGAVELREESRHDLRDDLRSDPRHDLRDDVRDDLRDSPRDDPRDGAAPRHPPFEPAAPAEGRFVSGRHGAGRAGRDFKLFIPPQAAAGARLPLVVMLHGCTQHADDFAAGTNMNALARSEGFYVLYPEQSARANPQRCWNWFKAQHQQRGRGEPATLAAMTRQVMDSHAIDPARVYVAGLSAGGAMAAVMGQAYPDLFAAVGVHSGLPAGAAADLPGALAAMQGQAADAPAACAVPTIVFHGDADATVHARNGAAVFAAARPGDGTVTSQPVRGRGRAATRHQRVDGSGRVVAEHWVVHGGAHAWSGGHSAGSYTDPAGPDASAEMLRFFLAHRRR